MSRWLSTVTLLLAFPAIASASTYTVTATVDAGPGSLRAAIQQANAHSGPDTITFAAALSGKTIKPATVLPFLTGDGTTINGDLDGDGHPEIALDGQAVPTESGLTVLAHNCVVAGLAIYRFPNCCIQISAGAANCVVRSCHLAVNLAGSKAIPNSAGAYNGVYVLSATHITIGGSQARYRNIVAAGSGGATGSALRFDQVTDSRVSGNYIGLKRDGSGALNSGHYGLILLGSGCTGNTVGGTGVAEGNFFAGAEQGLWLTGASNNTILGNTFGLGADGNLPLTIATNDVGVNNGSVGNVIGGTTAAARNVFAGGAIGIWFAGAGTTGNTVQGNYFGTNRAGTARKPLATGVNISYGGGPQMIGGNTAAAGNYFATSLSGGSPTGVSVAGSSTNGTTIRHNTFGVLPSGAEATGLQEAVRLWAGANARITDNTIARCSVRGIEVTDSGSSASIFTNKIRNCPTGVAVLAWANASLGNLGNASTTDDGGNVFQTISTYFIDNRTANAIKAEGNSFGTTSKAAINAKIHDKLDDPALGRVDFDPLHGGIHPTGSTSGPVALASAAAIPVRSGAEITFSLTAPASVTVRVLNLAGRLVAAPVRDLPASSGLTRLSWTGRTTTGTLAPPGRYLVEVTARDDAGHEVRAVCPLTAF